jgi:hypothetical protein
LWRAAAEVEEGGGLSAMIVLLLKQMHLQKDVAVDFAAKTDAAKHRMMPSVRWPIERVMANIGAVMSRSSLLTIRTQMEREHGCTG